MVYNAGFKAFSPREHKLEYESNDGRARFLAWNRAKEQLAADADSFGGRRLLGVTEKGSPIFVSFNIDKETQSIQMKLTHKIDTILQSNLCPRRITLGTNKPLDNLNHAMRPTTKTDNGEVTPNTIRYIDKLMTMAESTTMGKVKGKCSSQLFMLVSNLVHEGSVEDGEFRWRDVMTTWNLPKGEYITVYG
tara:strand:+ start:166 stop:738 length:573 start_codon:yes stop_codon:yes gene_type:complete